MWSRDWLNLDFDIVMFPDLSNYWGEYKVIITKMLAKTTTPKL